MFIIHQDNLEENPLCYKIISWKTIPRWNGLCIIHNEKSLGFQERSKKPAICFIVHKAFLDGMKSWENYDFYRMFKSGYNEATETKTKVSKGQKLKILKKTGGSTMIIEKSAVAGTLESSDAQITVEPAEGLEVSIESSVLNQYGRQIKETVEETLNRLEVKNAKVTVVDKGALDCTLKARVECAIFRSCEKSAKNIPWGGVIHE